ncbi:hypothetical protein E4U30_007167 [Claviceps sp. LM220 group G6]|nr:hypothetical protein E4U30_007167 [Claviceps sp. LM220 group G6]
MTAEEIVLPATIDMLEGMAVERGSSMRKLPKEVEELRSPTKILDSVVVNMMLHHLDLILFGSERIY